MLPLIPIAISLAAKYIPSLIGKLAGDNAEKVAEQVVGMASSITGKADPQQAHDAIMADPKIALEFEKAGMQLTLDLYKEDTKRLETVNTTMRAESTSSSLWQRSWRPFNGFAFGITLFCDYFVSQIVQNFINYKMEVLKVAALKAGIEYVPFIFTWTHIPSSVYMLWTTVLGVTAGSRGLEKVNQAKLVSPNNNLPIKDLLKLFGKGVIGR